MMVPPRIRECPFCGAKYTNFEYFKMNWLPAAVAGVAVLIIGLNVADIMIFNKEIRSAVNEQQPDGQRLERLKEKYENKSSFKKKFIRYSELNIMTDNSNMPDKLYDYADYIKLRLVINLYCSRQRTIMVTSKNS